MNRNNNDSLKRFLNEKINEKRFREHDGYTGYRTWYQHDIDEIIYSLPFRRLAFKSQLITPVNENGRTRLVHTLDVNRIAVNLAKSFGLCTTLTEAISLGHDLGQTPFGKACSKAFEEIEEELKKTEIVEDEFVLFSHEEFSHEIAEKIGKRRIKKNSQDEGEKVYFDKLKKHITNKNKCGVFGKRPFQTKIRKSGKEIIENTLAKHTLNGILLHNKYRTKERPERLEAQIVQMADDFAYVIEDIEDGMKTGLININDLKKFENKIRNKITYSEDQYIAKIDLLDICAPTSRKRFDVMIRRTVNHNLSKYRDEVKEKNINLEYDPTLNDIIKSIWDELLPKMHEKISSSFERAKYEVRFLFRQLLEPKSLQKDKLLKEFISKNNYSPIPNKSILLRVIAKYIAYMTDNEFLENVDRYFRRTMYDSSRKGVIKKQKVHNVKIDEIRKMVEILNAKEKKNEAAEN